MSETTSRPDAELETAVTVERRGHVLLMGLNRPAKRNAFNLAMIDQLDPEMEGKRGRAYGLAYSTQPTLGEVREGRAIEGRPLYGAPMKPCALAFCPTNRDATA